MKQVKRRAKRFYFLIAIAVILIAYVVWVFQFSNPSIKPTYLIKSFNEPTQAVSFAWPTYGESAIGVNNFGVVESNGKQTPVPMASTAKLITSLCVLAKDPITDINNSPVITLTQDDVNIYIRYLALQGSVVPVVAGEKVSEYQILEAMLLPSANNMADSLAIWAFGSLQNYSSYANNYLKSVGLNNTTVGTDASGFDPSTVTTASDLVKLGQLVLANPVLNKIVATKEIDNFPGAGTIKNVNSLLGTQNIIGIKTGNTTQAGGVFLSASDVSLGNQTYVVTTAVMGAPMLWQALNDSAKLIKSAQANFVEPNKVQSISKGFIAGEYHIPWLKNPIEAVTEAPITLSIWGGNSINTTVFINSITDKAKESSVVGNINAKDTKFNTQSSVKLILNSQISKPSRLWLLIHPYVSL